MTSKKQQSANREMEYLKEQPTVTPNELALQQARTQKVMGELSKFDVTALIRKLGDLSTSITKQLNDTGIALVEATKELTILNDGLEIKSNAMRQLYGNEAIVAYTQELVAEHERKMATMAAETTQWAVKQKEAENAFYAEMDQRRSETARRRQQEEQIYIHERDIERAKDKAAFEAQMAEARRKEQVRHEALLTDWEKRESGLWTLENEFGNLKDRVEKFPEVLEQAVQRARDSAIQATERDLVNKHKLEQASRISEIQLLQQGNQNLIERLEMQDSEISRLRQELKESQARMAEMAKNSFEAAGSIASLKAVQETVASGQKR